MGPLRGRPAWNQVSAPVNTASESSSPSGMGNTKGSTGLLSKTMNSNVQVTAGMPSKPSNQAIGRGNVKKIPSKSPVNDVTSVAGGKGYLIN